MSPITLLPIGYVESRFSEMTASGEMRRERSRLVLNAALAEGLDGLHPGDEIVVLFFCDQSDGYALRAHPRGDSSRPERGVFALRSQYRPNPIGVTVARIEAVEGHILSVIGLDALDGSPLLDIKPHTPCFDGSSSGEQEPSGQMLSRSSEIGAATYLEE